jgi:6-phosphofructokinase
MKRPDRDTTINQVNKYIDHLESKLKEIREIAFYELEGRDMGYITSVFNKIYNLTKGE